MLLYILSLAQIALIAMALASDKGAGLEEATKTEKAMIKKAELYISTLRQDKQVLAKNYLKKVNENTKMLLTIDDANDMREVFATVADSFDAFMSGDSEQIAVGMVSIMNSMTQFIPNPIVGAAVGSALSLAVGLLGLDQEDPMETMIEDLLNRKLASLYEQVAEKIDDAHMRSLVLDKKADAAGAIRTLKEMKQTVVTKLFNMDDVQETDMHYLIGHAKSYYGQEELGSLQYVAQELIKALEPKHRSNTVKEKSVKYGQYSYYKRSDADLIYSLMESYTELSALRKGMLVLLEQVYLKSELTKTSAMDVRQKIESIYHDDQWLNLEKFDQEKRLFLRAAYKDRNSSLTAYYNATGTHPHEMNHKLIENGCFKATYLPADKKIAYQYGSFLEEGTKFPISFVRLAVDTTGGMKQAVVNVEQSPGGYGALNLILHHNNPFDHSGSYKPFQGKAHHAGAGNPDFAQYDVRSKYPELEEKFKEPALEFVVLEVTEGKFAILYFDENEAAYFLGAPSQELLEKTKYGADRGMLSTCVYSDPYTQPYQCNNTDTDALAWAGIQMDTVCPPPLPEKE